MDLKSKVYNNKGEVKKETVDLPEEIFGVEWNPELLHQIVVSMHSNRRFNIAHTKDRSEVRGGGKKPWRQKGTGRARHGSIRSPIWVGGGVTFGPRNERNFDKKINKKMLIKSFFSGISKKHEEGEIIFVEDLNFEKPSAKEAKEFFQKLEKNSGVDFLKKEKNAMVIFIPEKDEKIVKSFNNFKNLKIEETKNANPLHLFENKYILFVNPENAISFFQEKHGRLKNRFFSKSSNKKTKTGTSVKNKKKSEKEKTTKNKETKEEITV